MNSQPRILIHAPASGGGLCNGEKGNVHYTTAVNSKVNGQPKNLYFNSNSHLRCQNADPRVLTATCSIRTEFQDSGFSYNDACPGNGTTVSTTAPASTDTTASTAATAPTAEAALAADTVSAGATASTAATAAGITIGTLVGLGIVGFTGYQLITGHREGLRGQKLAMKPLTRGKELASAAVNSVSQGIQGVRERMNRQRVPAQIPTHEMSQVLTDRVTELDKRL